jgi:hypothetical protein
MSTPRPALFVAFDVHLQPNGGGNQICTHEYRSIVVAAGYAPEDLAFGVDMRWTTRLRRRLKPRPYADFLPPDLLPRILARAKALRAEAVFCNFTHLLPLAEPLRAQLPPECAVVLLSHGLDSVDYVHAVQSEGELSPRNSSAAQERRLGQQVLAEARHLRHFDLVVNMNPVENEVTRWLGARRAIWLPRTVRARPLDWRPDPRRLGFVGTLDHPPNRHGLHLFLRELAQVQSASPVRVRLVGGPAALARDLAAQFDFVDALGLLKETELTQEAATWGCFLHPLFCQARGASMKVATALGWQLPLATTADGCRGYAWPTTALPLAHTPRELVRLALDMLDPAVAARCRDAVRTIAAAAPTVVELGQRLRAALDEVAAARNP